MDPLGISEGPQSFSATHMSAQLCKSIIKPDPVLDGRGMYPAHDPSSNSPRFMSVSFLNIFFSLDEELFIVPDDCYITHTGEGKKLPLREIKKRLEDAYCGSIGVEFMHIANDEEKDWLKQKFEHQHGLSTADEQKLTLERLVR